LQDDGIRHLVRPRGIGHARSKVRRRVIPHPGKHAGERQDHIVLRVRRKELHPADAFDSNNVRIGSLQARRLIGAMKIDQQLVLRGRFGHHLVEIDHLLVLVVEEVYLDPRDAHPVAQIEPFLHRGGVRTVWRRRRADRKACFLLA
jgi:hypothetical protein